MHACLCRLMGLGFQIVLIVLFVSESENLFIRMGIDFCIIFFFNKTHEYFCFRHSALPKTISTIHKHLK